MGMVGNDEDVGGDVSDLWLAGVNGVLNVNESGKGDAVNCDPEGKELAGVEMKDKLLELDGIEDKMEYVPVGEPVVFEELRLVRGFLFELPDHGVANRNVGDIEFEWEMDSDDFGSLNISFVYSGLSKAPRLCAE
jgi:hypothetical protein